MKINFNVEEGYVEDKDILLFINEEYARKFIEKHPEYKNSKRCIQEMIVLGRMGKK